jgi:hypothetical protein
MNLQSKLAARLAEHGPIHLGGGSEACAEPSETLDGEGGFTVYCKLLPASRSVAEGALPIGLAHGVRLNTAVSQHTVIRWADVAIDSAAPAVRIRREAESALGNQKSQTRSQKSEPGRMRNERPLHNSCGLPASDF